MFQMTKSAFENYSEVAASGYIVETMPPGLKSKVLEGDEV